MESELKLLNEFEEAAICNRLEGWELVEYLQVPVEEVLAVALANGWITVDNEAEVLEFVGITID